MAPIWLLEDGFRCVMDIESTTLSGKSVKSLPADMQNLLAVLVHAKTLTDSIATDSVTDSARLLMRSDEFRFACERALVTLCSNEKYFRTIRSVFEDNAAIIKWENQKTSVVRAEIHDLI
jgi:hypothetical protein